MSTTLTTSALRILVGEAMGEGITSGTTTTAPTSSAQDNTRFDPDTYWTNGWFQDTTISGGSIQRIQSWTQSNQTFTFWGTITGGLLGDAYEVHRLLGFNEFRRAINNALALVGKSLRQAVRDETQSLVANTYQYSVNTNPANANAFFPGPSGVTRISFQYWVGQPTREFIDIPFEFLDDTTIQLPENIVDGFSSDTIRFSGYGPITQRLTSDSPSFVIGTFTDEFAIEMLLWATVAQAWNILASKKTSGESTTERENAKIAEQLYVACRDNWRRGPVNNVLMPVPTAGGGWSGT